MTGAAEHAACLAELEQEQAPDGTTPLQFIWNGVTRACSAGSAHRSKRNEPGGFALEADLVIIARAELFTPEDLAILKAGTKNTLTHDGRQWRITAAITPSGDPFVKLLCNDPAQSA